MTRVPQQLKDAAAKAHGTSPTRSVKLKTFLSWFGAKRRGAQVSAEIRAALQKEKLATDPDFMTANIDGRIRLQPLSSNTTSPPRRETVVAPELSTKESAEIVAEQPIMSDPTPRLGTVFGGEIPVSVRRDDTIAHAITLMIRDDYSQLPVMSSSKQVEGLISWKSIGKEFNVQKKDCQYVRDCIDTDVEVLRWDKPLWEALKTIADKDVVLIKDKTNEIVGIITSYDLANQYHAFNEPFFLLGEIENNLRQLATKANFAISILAAAKDPKDTKRTITGVDKLTFGELARMLDEGKNWERIHLKLARTAFMPEIRKIVKIRNDVMHFSPDPLELASLRTLRQAANMFRGLKLFENP